MKSFIAPIIFCQILFQGDALNSFVGSGQEQQCKCFITETKKKIKQSYFFKFTDQEKVIAGKKCYVTLSNYLSGSKPTLLRVEENKVLEVDDFSGQERVIMDFNLKLFQNFSMGTSDFLLKSKRYDRALNDTIHRFELKKKATSSLHTCWTIAFEATKIYGYVKLEFECPERVMYSCICEQQNVPDR